MDLITRKTRAATVAADWELFYGGGKYGEGQKDVGEKLRGLGPAPCPDRVDELAGNTYWTRIRTCDECGDKVGALVSIDKHVQICKPCVSKALALFPEDV
jgi:hypothetical protein